MQLLLEGRVRTTDLDIKQFLRASMFLTFSFFEIHFALFHSQETSLTFTVPAEQGKRDSTDRRDTTRGIKRTNPVKAGAPQGQEMQND